MLSRPIRAVVVAVLALAGLAFLPLPAASAAVPTGPSAVAVASNGITYVGFASGGSLTRVDASGAVLSPITLPRSGAVDGLAVDASDNIWVSYGYGASKISPTGAELTYFPYANTPATCPAADGSSDPTRYGGIAVSPTDVYVSGRCTVTIQRYSLTGTLMGAINPPARTRGITYVPAQPNVGAAAKIFFSVPDTGKVYEYPSAWAGNGGLPTFVLDVYKGGSSNPVPSGIVADKYGQLAVVDAANDYVYLYDTNNRNAPTSYSLYRILGRPGSNLGDLSNATAIAQYPVDGPLTDRRGDFFLGDTGNNRIQRWNTSGYTYWSASTNGGVVTPTAPVNTGLPSISGTPAVGQTLSCSTGSWSGSPTSYSYGWNRNGSAIGGATSSSYTVVSADGGQQLSCFVRATNGAGQSDYATSAPVTVAAGPAAPANTAPPTISGTAAQGQTLTCNPGSWTGSPSFAYAWLRNGTQVATGATHVVVAGDVGQAITCRVTATNGAGSTSVTSAAVTPTGAATCSGVAGTVSINSGATYTTSESVSLRIRAVAGATQVMISNDGGFDGATAQALSGTCTYPWTLALTGSARDAKVVYVRFLDGSGSELGQRATDDIVLDKTAPSVARAVTSRSGKVTVVTVSAHDAVSGLKKVQYAAKRGAKGTTVAWKPRLRTTKPAKFAWIRVYDRAGNVSAWKRSVRR